MKSKFVALFLVAALLCFAVVGCAPKATEGEGEAVTESSAPVEEESAR